MDDYGVLCRLRDGFLLASKPGQAAFLVELAHASDGRTWISNAGLLYELRGGSLLPLPLPAGRQGYLQGITARRHGGLWAVFGNQLWIWLDGNWTPSAQVPLFASTPLHCFIETRSGQLLAGTSDHGAFLYSPGTGDGVRQLWRETGFPADWITSMLEDHEGNLWLGTGGSGLFMVRPSPISTPAPADHWQGRALLTVTPSRLGGLWVGTEGAGLYRIKGEESSHFAKDAGLRAPYVWSLHEDKSGVLWLGTWGGGVYSGTGDSFRPVPGLPQLDGPVGALTTSSAGGLWIGSTGGLLLLRDGVAATITPSTGRGPRDLCALIDDGKGTVWVGSRSEGLWALHPATPGDYHRLPDAGADQVQCLHLDSEGSLWIGTVGGGLRRLRDGKFVSIGPLQGIGSATVCHISEDLLGNLWLSTNSGILQLSRAELNRCADGLQPQVQSRNFGLGDGLPTLKASGGAQPSGCLLPDGRLAFATSRGLVLIDPTRISTNCVPPPVIIETVLLNGRPQSPFGAAPLKVQPGEHRLELHYTGLSFASPEKVRFRHRILGLDEAWNEVGASRSAEYNYLPPGSYRFEVLACNNDGVWSTAPASLAFVILPRFYQTGWFRLLCLLCLLGASSALAWYSTRRRERLKLQRLQQQRAIELERSRIANDMHDDLGSQLTRITMLSEGARGPQRDPSRAAENLAHIYETARRMTRSMDEIVWAVNPKHDRVESLVNYLEKYASDFLGAADLRFRLDLPMDFPVWTPGSELRHNLFLAFREVLNNTVRHAGATLVEISVTLDESEFRLSVADNGRGFTPPSSMGSQPSSAHPASSACGDPGRIASGNGLPGVHARMARIGGRCELSSSPGKGTRILLIAPVHSQHDSP